LAPGDSAAIENTSLRGSQVRRDGSLRTRLLDEQHSGLSPVKSVYRAPDEEVLREGGQPVVDELSTIDHLASRAMFLH